jgi:hypothetical protein
MHVPRNEGSKQLQELKMRPCPSLPSSPSLESPTLRESNGAHGTPIQTQALSFLEHVLVSV